MGGGRFLRIVVVRAGAHKGDIVLGDREGGWEGWRE